MAKTGVVKKTFPYSIDGVTVENLAEGRILSFPDRIFDGLKEGGHIIESGGTPENSVIEAQSRDLVDEDLDRRLMVASDLDLKAIIARSGSPISGNLVHAILVQQAKAQLQREAAGKEPVLGIDPTSGVTEQPLAAPGSPTPPSAPALVAAAQTQADVVRASGGAGVPREDGKTKGPRPKVEA